MQAIEYELPVGGAVLPHVSSLSTGSTHTVVWVNEMPDDATFARLSPLIEHHAWFPERTSVLWALVESSHAVAVRIWERGAGETLACGTGACAVAVAAQLTNRCKSEGCNIDGCKSGINGGIDVSSRGGVLRVNWPGGAGEIQMTGPARIVYAGTAPFGAE